MEKWGVAFKLEYFKKFYLHLLFSVLFFQSSPTTWYGPLHRFYSRLMAYNHRWRLKRTRYRKGILNFTEYFKIL